MVVKLMLVSRHNAVHDLPPGLTRYQAVWRSGTLLLLLFSTLVVATTPARLSKACRTSLLGASSTVGAIHRGTQPAPRRREEVHLGSRCVYSLFSSVSDASKATQQEVRWEPPKSCCNRKSLPQLPQLATTCRSGRVPECHCSAPMFTLHLILCIDSRSFLSTITLDDRCPTCSKSI